MSQVSLEEENAESEPRGRRPVRSFVLRGGRLTDGQKRALEELWPQYGVPDREGELDFYALFGNQHPVIMEIGFGNGEATWKMAAQQPEKNFIGVEVHQPGVGHLLLKLASNRITNVRVACADAVELLRDRVPDASLEGVRIYFPDPWPKKRHHKRRIIQRDFIELLAEKMQHGAILHMATDWEAYAEFMLEVMRDSRQFENLSPHDGTYPRPEWRPQTRYEKRGERLGHCVHDLVFRRAA